MQVVFGDETLKLGKQIGVSRGRSGEVEGEGGRAPLGTIDE